MKKLFFVIAACLVLVVMSCQKKIKIYRNNDFKMALDSYYSYIDSVGYKPDFDYIFIHATTNRDSTEFLMCLVGGAYDFITIPEKIIDFFKYNKCDILLAGDFPNKVVNIKRNEKLNIIDDIVKIRYPADYNKYVKDKYLVAPLIYDYMNMTLIFKNDRLISCKRQYY